MNHYATTVSPFDVADPNDLLAKVAMWPECCRVLRRGWERLGPRYTGGIPDLLELLANWGPCA